jgi:hypothetical protein
MSLVLRVPSLERIYMLSKIFVGLVGAGLLSVGGYLYYNQTPCNSCHRNNAGGVNPPASCPTSQSSECSLTAPSSTALEPSSGALEVATDTLPMPREVVTQ